jgi:ABC-type phosphate transport system substrate-binding protein
MYKRNKLWAGALVLMVAGVVHDARADVVVIVSAKSSASTMSAEQISQIYLGRSTALKPIDTGGNSPVRAQFYSKVAGKDEAQVKAIWSKLIFSGQATPPKELGSSAEVVKAVAADPGAIGYVDKSAIDSSVKVIFEPK